MPPRIKTPKDLDVVILCGGTGTRLRSVVHDRPKPMAEVQGRPFLDLLIAYFAGYGCRRFVLCTGHQGDRIRDYYAASDLEIAMSHETEPLGTAGAVAHAKDMIHSDPFLLINGDSHCPVDVAGLLAFHRSRQAQLTLVVTQSEDTKDQGRVIFGQNFRLIRFDEKDPEAGAGYVNAGIYLLEKIVLSQIPKEGRCSLEYDLLPRQVSRDTYVYVCDAPLIDIGTPERYAFARTFFANHEIYPHPES